jgi:osmotically-inducible protein OsmY
MNDVQLRQEVLRELDFDRKINAHSIGVAVDAGVVTLTGQVASYAEKVAAEQAARRVKGVRAIAQEIEIRHADDKKTIDHEIAGRVLSVLKWHAKIPQDVLNVTVERGIVTLAGELDSEYQRRAAEDAIRKIPGVVGLVNDISLKPRVLVPDIRKETEKTFA